VSVPLRPLSGPGLLDELTGTAQLDTDCPPMPQVSGPIAALQAGIAADCRTAVRVRALRARTGSRIARITSHPDRVLTAGALLGAFALRTALSNAPVSS
jgi:hypothetical protein